MDPEMGGCRRRRSRKNQEHKANGNEDEGCQARQVGPEGGTRPSPSHGRNRRPAKELPDRQVRMIKLNYKPHEQWGFFELPL